MFKDHDQNQIQLLTPSLNEIIPQDHIARLISQVIDELDISFIKETYSPNGQKAYDPRMLP